MKSELVEIDEDNTEHLSRSRAAWNTAVALCGREPVGPRDELFHLQFDMELSRYGLKRKGSRLQKRRTPRKPNETVKKAKSFYSSHCGGHSIVSLQDRTFYEDTGEAVDWQRRRPCRACGKEFTPCEVCGANDEDRDQRHHDPCLGHIPGIESACCGHGYIDEDGRPSLSYLSFTSMGALTEDDRATIKAALNTLGEAIERVKGERNDRKGEAALTNVSRPQSTF